MKSRRSDSTKSRRASHAVWIIFALSFLLTVAVLPAEDSASRLEAAELPVPVQAKAVGGNWKAQGPAPITPAQVENVAPGNQADGAIHDVAPHPTSSKIIYVGSVNGGVWKTNNADATNPTWQSLTDDAPSTSIGALEFDPTDSKSDTLVAGIGNFSSFGRLGGELIGLLRTRDGGQNWEVIDGGLAGKNISGVAPRGTTLVASVNIADAFTFGNIGIFRSTDDGASFTRISGTAGTGLPFGLSYDLVSDPNNQQRLFTNVLFADFVGGQNGVYRSDDAGATWTKVSSPAMDALLVSGVTNNVEHAVGQHNNVYTAIANSGRLVGLFRSGDGGATWTSLDIPSTGAAGTGIHPGGQSSIHLSIAADPTDANIVYVGGDRQPSSAEEGGAGFFPNSIGANGFTGRLFRIDASQASGSQAAHITHTNTASNSSPHADSRDMAFTAAGELIEGDDGGIYMRTDARSNTGDWISLNGDIQVAEVHDVSYDTFSDVNIAGLQDNGTPIQYKFNDLDYFLWVGGDGGDVAVDTTSTPDVSIRYTSAQLLQALNRSFWDNQNNALGFAFLGLVPINGSGPIAGQFSTPLELNRVDATRIVIGGANSVYESLDQGDTIDEVGPGIVANGTGFDALGYGYPGNVDFLLVGAGDRVFTRSGAPPAKLSESLTYPSAGSGFTVRDVVIDQDTGITYLTNRNEVWATPDEGATWTNLTGNIQSFEPQFLRAITYVTDNQGDALVVSTFNGVLVAKEADGFAVWNRLGSGLPNAPILDLDFDAENKRIIAGTLGRGNWRLNSATINN